MQVSVDVFEPVAMPVETGEVMETTQTEEAEAAAESAESAEAPQTREEMKPGDCVYISAGVSQVMTEDGQVLTRKKHSRRKRRRARRVGVALAVVGVLLILACACVFLLPRIGEKQLKADIDYSEGLRVQYEGKTYAYDRDMLSILVVGFDQKGNDEMQPHQADVIMLFAFDTVDGNATCIVVPRDSMVEVDETIGDVFAGIDTMQVCLAYAYGSGGEDSCEYTERAVSRLLLDVPIGAYFALDTEGIAPLNDAIGGVSLTPVETIASAGIYAGVTTTLDGEQARSYVGTRDVYEYDSSLSRQSRQMQYVSCYAEQALQAASNDLSVLTDLYGILGDYSVTDLDLGSYTYLAKLLVNLGVTSVEMVSLEGTMEDKEPYVEYHLDKDALKRTVIDVFYDEVVEDEMGEETGEPAASGREEASVSEPETD